MGEGGTAGWPWLPAGPQHKVPWCKAVAGGFAHGQPLGSTGGFVPGQPVASQELGKVGETLPAFTPKLWYPSQGAPSPSSSVVPCWDVWPGNGAGCRGHGEKDLPVDVYWQFANVKKRPGGDRGHPGPRGCLHLGRGPAWVRGPPLPGTP